LIERLAEQPREDRTAAKQPSPAPRQHVIYVALIKPPRGWRLAPKTFESGQWLVGETELIEVLC
jgi:hypothetical protein